jgi:hypothetical protein
VKIAPGFSRAVHVVIKVSLQNLIVYAKEGDKPLLVAATAIGTLINPTPPGRFRVTLKIENKRSNSYGSWVTEDTIVPDKSSRRGAPRLILHWLSHTRLWFHVESLWPIPRTYDGLHQMLPVSFSRSPASAPRSTLPKLNRKTQLGARTLRAHKTITIPIRQ